ncbi:MAG: nitrile hydratase subunit alpha [Haloferacaceae archaeon]
MTEEEGHGPHDGDGGGGDGARGDDGGDGHGHDHGGGPDPHADVSPDDPRPRTRAIQSLLIEKGLLSTEAVDEVVSAYEEEIGPLNGARVVARAWTDPGFKRRLLDDATAAIAAADFDFEVGLQHLRVVENTPDTHNVVVCTLCSCYPWSLLGLPPTWYKSPAYRSRIVREPRAVLREFGTDLDESVDVEVWDSSSELRYMVLPRRPAGTEGMDRASLADLVTRNAMVGVEEVPAPR